VTLVNDPHVVALHYKVLIGPGCDFSKALELALVEPRQPVQRIRTFLTGAGPIAIVDLPWIPVFLAICFLIHPWLGLVATGGGIVLFAMTLQTNARAVHQRG
jgi:ABC-type protease/lipase transport system fused ATPase/permease subunit